MNPLAVIAGPIIDGVVGFFERKQNRQARELELEQEIHLQKIDYVKQGRIAEVEWNKNSTTQAGWVTDWVALLLSIPLVLSFIPSMVPYVREGFAVLETMPVYYRAAVGLMIGFAFGYRKYADWQMQKHYTLPDPMNVVTEKKDKNE